MIPAFSKELIDAVVRLENDNDFKLFTDYIKTSIREMAISSVEMSGVEADKVKGGCIAMMELRDMITSAKAVYEAEKERRKMAEIDRDPISP